MVARLYKLRRSVILLRRADKAGTRGLELCRLETEASALAHYIHVLEGTDGH